MLIISKIENGEIENNRIHFNNIEKQLRELISMFGGRPLGGGPKPEQPFFHLSSSELWNIHGIETNSYNKTIKISILRSPEVYGYLNTELFNLLKLQEVRSRIIDFILNNWWPGTVHDDIRMYLNLTRYNDISKTRRNRTFVEQVLSNYRYKCAFCGFDAVVNKIYFGLDAAHIKWFSQKGPDELRNGLALCKLHHWAFDRGVLTLDTSLKIMVSKKFIAKDPFSIAYIEELNGKPIGRYKIVEPSGEFLEWHNENVFLG